MSYWSILEEYDVPHGKGHARQAEGGWSIEDPAEIAGRTRTSVTDNVALAKAPENFPILANCKPKSDIKRTVKGLQRIANSVEALSSFD